MDEEDTPTTADIAYDEKSAQNLERDTELSPRGDYSEKNISSPCPDLNSENSQQLEQSHQLEAGENITKKVPTIKPSAESLSKWEERQEKEIKTIEPVSSDFTTNRTNGIGEDCYWSSVGLLRNRKTGPLCLDPGEEKRDSDSTNSAYDEEVVNLINPTEYSDYEDHSENENETTVHNNFGSLDEISIGGDYKKINSLENDEPVEKLKIKDRKKCFLARLFGRVFQCNCYKKQTR